ncbi:hypothetical protein D3C81_1406090 [compost metagenome]|jgi:hypothetical protein
MLGFSAKIQYIWATSSLRQPIEGNYYEVFCHPIFYAIFCFFKSAGWTGFAWLTTGVQL